MYNNHNNGWHQAPLQQSYNDYGYQGGAGFVPPGGSGRGWEGQGGTYNQGYNASYAHPSHSHAGQSWSAYSQPSQTPQHNAYNHHHGNGYNNQQYNNFSPDAFAQLNLGHANASANAHGYGAGAGGQWQTPFAPSPVAQQQNNNWQNNPYGYSNQTQTNSNNQRTTRSASRQQQQQQYQPAQQQQHLYDYPSAGFAAPEPAQHYQQPQPLYNNRWEPLDQPRRYNTRQSSQARPPSPGNWLGRDQPAAGYASRPSSPGSQAARIPNTPGKRSAKVKRDGPAPEPTPAYLALVDAPAPPPSSERAPLLVLDLNNTLLCRRAKSSAGSAAPLARPYLATFLSYITGLNEAGRARWQVAVYSSAKAQNVLKMLEALELVQPGAVEQTGLSNGASQAKGQWVPGEGDKVGLVWSREWMGLSPREFDSNVETVKELEPVWVKLGMGQAEGVRRTLLLDDEASKAATQPHNHLPIEGFFVDSQHFPDPPNPPTNARSRTPSPPPSSRPSSPSGSPSRRPPQPRQVYAPLDIRPEAPQAEDAALLSTIFFLSRLEREANVAKFVKEGGIEKLRAEVGGEEGAVAEGRRECERVGVRVAREWRSGWARGE